MFMALTVTSLPTEVLIVIVTAAWRLYHENIDIHRRPFEIRISRVNRVFREIALSEPVLWTNISSFPSRNHRWLTTYLERSGPRLYDYSLDYTAPSVKSIPPPEYLQLLVSAITDNVDRLRSFHLQSGGMDSFLFILQELTIQAPNLERLKVAAKDHRFSTPFVIAPFQSGAPKLKYIDLERCMFARNCAHAAPTTIIRVTHLDSIARVVTPHTESKAILTNLVLRSPVHAPKTIALSHIASIALPNLCQLTVEFATRFPKLFTKLSLPSLVSLVIVNLEGHELPRFLDDMSPRNLPLLTSLTFVNLIHTTSWTLQSEIHNVSPLGTRYVERLALVGMEDIPVALKSLDIDVTHPRSILFPSLQSLYISEDGVSGVHDGVRVEYFSKERTLAHFRRWYEDADDSDVLDVIFDL